MSLLESIIQPYQRKDLLKAYEALKSYYPESALKDWSMDYWFQTINESSKLGHLTSGQELLLAIYKKELERIIKGGQNGKFFNGRV